MLGSENTAKAAKMRLEYARANPFMSLLVTNSGVVIMGLSGLTAEASLETWEARGGHGNAEFDTERWQRAVLGLIEEKGLGYVFQESFLPMATRLMPHWRELAQAGAYDDIDAVPVTLSVLS